ncbi:hypothetical protein H1C71_029136, partial [Ictidomys tridecemlineatus]
DDDDSFSGGKESQPPRFSRFSGVFPFPQRSRGVKILCNSRPCVWVTRACPQPQVSGTLACLSGTQGRRDESHSLENVTQPHDTGTPCSSLGTGKESTCPRNTITGLKGTPGACPESMAETRSSQRVLYSWGQRGPLGSGTWAPPLQSSGCSGGLGPGPLWVLFCVNLLTFACHLQGPREAVPMVSLLC